MSSRPEPLAAVCLDVDGTLYSLARMILGHPLTFARLRSFFRALHAVRATMRGQGPFADLRAEQAVRLAAALGIEPAEAAARVEEVVDRRWMAVFERVRPHPGVADCLAGLLDRGLRLAILSDYPVWPKLGGLGLAHLPFAAIVDTEQVGALKPHPAGFQEVLRRLELPAARVVHIGDLETSDVAGALGVGMRAIRFYERRRPATRAAFALRDWRQLIPLLRWRGWID